MYTNYNIIIKHIITFTRSNRSKKISKNNAYYTRKFTTRNPQTTRRNHNYSMYNRMNFTISRPFVYIRHNHNLALIIILFIFPIIANMA